MSTATVTRNVSQDQIAARAYHIWQRAGCPAGKEQDHWLQAERELQTEKQPQRSNPVSTGRPLEPAVARSRRF